MTYTQQANAQFDGALPADFQVHFNEHLRDIGFPVHPTAEGFRAHMPEASVEMSLAETGFAVTILSSSTIHLHQTREGFLQMLNYLFPDAVDQLDWSGEISRNIAPPNFHLVSVASVRRISPNFLRVTMACENVGALLTGGMHFSLLLPPEGRAPVWPHINDEGRTIWAEGEDQLHRAPYTFVDLDVKAGTFSFDVFEHDGGRTTEWARHTTKGDVVAVVGPGGGTFPTGDFLLMAGDETALPAMRRILEHSDPARRGAVFIELGDMRDKCPIAAPEGVTVTWVQRGSGDTILDQICAAGLPETEQSHFVWFAAERDQVRRAKSHFRDTVKIERTQGYFSTYWTS
ncbi:siderophore-interacting protein [Actibacterium lipolyticum]|uniref:Vibriobactin utilization protein ViuB n=1 Tax=Actibacterium lipolyticum TaxID=1524263 RepID=A0A238L883_9RHOB|nr:siderophore-interacting protein [Actibacterium lipolyticum]SMX51218.1 Vibriobactin utilization protein ViuB [Actibacterium lipolyticum]